jgi:serine/threonine protein kinase
MKKIIINSGLSSGLRSDFSHVSSIEIEDKPFAVGGFGEVYNCTAINGVTPPIKQVVKLFIDNSKGSAEHNFKTTQRLQKKIDVENQKLLVNQSKTLTEVYPAFKGLPQYSFRGNLSGKIVIGFTSDNLVSLGFTDFENFLQDHSLLSHYQAFPVEQKMLIAYQLVSAFKVLEEFHFIHADLKPGALFINLRSAEIAVIDYDSGVITENINDEPLTWGAANDWVAPEIWEQQTTIQSGDKIRVDIYSDRWSVAIGVHYLMTTFHPLFYLTELSPRVAKQYFIPQNQWPFVNKSAPYFQKANEAIYDQYLPWVNTAIPKVVRDKLAHTINFGYRNPVARTSYGDWKVALQAIQQPPEIKYFKIDKTAVIDSMEVELSWEVENAHTITISENVGQVQAKGSIKAKPNSNKVFKLQASGYFGNVFEEVEVRVFPTPVMESLKVPMPDFTSRINLSPIKIGSPKIDVSIDLNIYTEKPKFTEGTIDLKSIRATHMPQTPVFKLSRIYETIRKRIFGQI